MAELREARLVDVDDHDALVEHAAVGALRRHEKAQPRVGIEVFELSQGHQREGARGVRDRHDDRRGPQEYAKRQPVARPQLEFHGAQRAWAHAAPRVTPFG